MPNPWYVPGWTSQQPYPGFDDIIITGPTDLPDNIPVVVVTGNYATITGFAGGGSVKFTLQDSFYDQTSKTLILPDSIVGTVKSGAMSVNIPAGFTYKVREFVPGGRTFYVAIPANQTTPVDIDSLPKVENQYG